MKTRIKRTVFALSLIVLAAASFKAQDNNNPLPTLRGEAAIEKLKQNGQYDSLLKAAEAATQTPAAANVFGQTAKLFAPDGAAFENFGFSVAISGNTAIVGSYQDTVGGNGVQGSAFVFVRSGATWTQQQKLTAADGAAGDLFGYSVAIDGDTAIVGAQQDNEGANNDQGSAYIFVRSGTIWIEQQKLLASDGAATDLFGDSVAISGDTVMVGALLDNIGANNDQGSAYIFVRSGTTWTQQQKLTASDGATNDWFGGSVAISGDTAIVGAYLDNNGSGIQQGSAYVFVRSGSNWTELQKLAPTAGTSTNLFGISISISGNTAIVGASGTVVGTNSEQGAAFVFVRSGTIWTQQAQLTAADGAAGDSFGGSVSIDGETAIVGAGNDNGGSNVGRGSAYVFVRSGTTWTQQQNLTASDSAAGDHFGGSVAISGNIIFVGAPSADVSALNSFAAPQAADQGAVFVFVPKVFVGGRILNAVGSGVPNAVVTLTKQNGEVIQTRSTPFGYYRFDDLDAGGIYTISVSAKQFTFATQIVEADDNLTSVDFTALP